MHVWCMNEVDGIQRGLKRKRPKDRFMRPLVSWTFLGTWFVVVSLNVLSLLHSRHCCVGTGYGQLQQ